MLRRLGRPIRTVLKWQLAATAAIAAGAAGLAGEHGAVSAAAGGLISVIAGLAAAVVASTRRGASSGGGLLAGALKAEAVKIGLAMFLLWLVLANYEAAVIPAFLVAFVATMLIFSMAFFVRED